MEWWENALELEENWLETALEVEDPGVFRPVWFDLSSTPNSSPAYVSRVHSITGVTCWIPALESAAVPKEFSDCMATRYEWQQATEIFHPSKYLFASGNHSGYRPEFIDRSRITQLAADHSNFRALLFLDDIQVSWDKDHHPLSFSCSLLEAVGCTPIRINPDGFTFWRCVGDISDRIVPTVTRSANDSPQFQVRIDLAFRLAGIALKLTHEATGLDAPWAWITLVCAIQLDRMQIKLQGSVIPSNSLYLAADRIFEYDMLNASCAEIHTFMKAENIPAPLRPIKWDHRHFETRAVHVETCIDTVEPAGSG